MPNKDLVWSKFRNCQPPRDFLVKSKPQILDKQIDRAFPHGWSQNQRIETKSRAFLEPMDNPRSACRILPETPPDKGLHCAQVHVAPGQAETGPCCWAQCWGRRRTSG